ncbi:hydrolase [Rhodobacteraceae bacterium CCMM004]|nr:hydrolase [Rhodobacteraceae bacterium CCMM004]
MAYTLRDFGSYTAGGHLAAVTEGTPRKIRFTRQAEYLYDPRGTFAVGHAYVQYFVPEGTRDRPPVLLVHGGGMSGTTWETTPDDRPGWLHRLLDARRTVHVIDAVERGRAGFAPGHFDGDPILRSLEEAWSLFRIGPAEGFSARRPYPDSQFPVATLDALARRFVPRWLTTGALQAAALAAVLERLGQASVLCHSQGAETLFDAMELAPGRVAAIAAVEPSALPSAPPAAPLLIVAGDRLDIAEHWADRAAGWRAFAAAPGVRYLDTAAEVAAGGSHLLMMDGHSDDVLSAVLAAGL